MAEERLYERTVIKAFRDKKDELKTYTRNKKYTGTADRINELYEKGHLDSGVEVKEEKPADEKKEDTENKTDESEEVELNHVGGGYYELPNGEKVKGKENALAALSKDGE